MRRACRALLAVAARCPLAGAHALGAAFAVHHLRGLEVVIRVGVGAAVGVGVSLSIGVVFAVAVAIFLFAT